MFAPAERALLGVLERAVGSDYRILGKVRASDVVSVRPMADRSAWRAAFNQITAKTFDFVLCDKEHLAVRCVIELNHQLDGARRRDEGSISSEQLCKAVSLPFVMVQAARDYSPVELRHRVITALSATRAAQAAGSEQPFSVGSAANAQGDDRPWTLDEPGGLGARAADVSDLKTF
jgi:hypothetical protein